MLRLARAYATVGLCRVRDFLLVRHSDLRPILHHFRDTAGFYVHDPPIFHSDFGGVPVGSDRPRWGQPEQEP